MYCHCNVKTGSRASGQSAAAKYDYISRDGKYAKAGRKEVVHLESGCMPAFASSDARLYWSAADSHERSNGRLFRSLTAALPNTLDAAARLELSRRFAAQVTGGELPYTLALHAGRSKQAGVDDNPHLHLVFSERVNDGVERGAEQWFRRASPKKVDPASGGARKTERTKPRSWLEETRSAWAGEMNLAFERAGVDDRATSESHATQLARARAAGDMAAEAHLLLNPPSTHIGPPAKHSWEDRPGRAQALKLDRYLAAEAAAAAAEKLRAAHAPDVAAAAEARSQVEELDARIAELEASSAAGERRARLDAREESVRATSQGGQWLDEEYQSVLARAGGRLTVGERERAVETVEGRLRADLAAREESLMATSTGSTLLLEEYGGGGDAADAQSFASWESVLERVARRVDEELGSREEALRSVPPGWRHLSAAEEARAGGAAGEPPSPAERESMVRAAERGVGEELDRREARVLAATADDRLLAEAAEELTERGAVSGDGGLAERARIVARAETLLEADRAELELEEAELLRDAAGEELLRNARRDVLGADDDGREAQTLADVRTVIDQASAAKARVEALGIGGMDLYHAHLADIDPKWGVDGTATTTRAAQDAALSAAESDVARLARLRAVLPDEAAAARFREVLDDSPGQGRFDTAALDGALAAGEREREERAAGERLAAREESVRATSQGGQWLDEEYQSVLARAGGRLTVGERERAVETVEGRLRADLAAREESLMATSTGSTLLLEEYGEGGDAADAQSFASWESVLERVAQRVDEELGSREEALRSIPQGRRHLSAAEEAREPPTPAERESTVRAAERRVGEELDRREARVLAATGDDRLLAEAAEELTERGAVSGDGGLVERARIIDRAEDLLAGEHAGLEVEEGALLKDAAGGEFLRNARRDVLGADDREAETLADDWAVINQASAAKARVEALGAGGMDLYHAHLADIDPKWGVDGTATTTRADQDAALSAAESDGARLARLRAVLSDEAAAARCREVLDDGPGRFDTAALDGALAAGEREREERAAARRAAALETATAAAQAAAARSDVNLHPVGVREIYETGETHAAGLAAVERTTEALDAAADQRLPARTILDTVTAARNANRSAPGVGIAAALHAAIAAARLKEERAGVEVARRQPAAVFPSREAATGILAAEIKEEHSGETAATLSEVERHLAQQRQTPAHELACAAVRKCCEDVKKRAGAASEQPAPPSRIRRIADWVLNCARKVLERLGLKPAPAPAHEAGPPPRRPEEASPPPPPPQPQPEPTLWERYQARWPQHAAADRALLEDLTEKPLPETLGGPIVDGVDVWRRKLIGMFERDGFHVGMAVPKPLPRELVPAGQASPDAALHAADYAASLPRWYRADFDRERIVERSRDAAEGARQTWRYRFAGEERRQTLEDDAVRQACGDDAQRLDREMHAERRRWQPHWDVLVRHDTLLDELAEEREQRERQLKSEQLQESIERSRTKALERAGPEPPLLR